MYLSVGQFHREPQTESKCSPTNVFGELWMYTGWISNQIKSNYFI